MRRTATASACVMCLALTACASFKPHYWSDIQKVPTPGTKATVERYLSASNPQDVQLYLSLHAQSYDKMMKGAEAGQIALELPVVVSSVAIPAGLALGKSDKFAIRMATVGVAANAGSNWLQPRQRLGMIVKARNAITCVAREYALEGDDQKTLDTVAFANAQWVANARSNMIQYSPMGAPIAPMRVTAADLMPTLKLALAAAESSPAQKAEVAIRAADAIASRLKVRLSELGTTPDFADALAKVREQYEKSKAKTEAVAGAVEASHLVPPGGASQLRNAVAEVVEYPARVQECVAGVG